MKRFFKKLGSILMVVFFPIGMLYLMIHAMMTDFKSFIGCLLLIGLGVAVGYFLALPDKFYALLNYLGNIWTTIVNFFTHLFA